MGRCEWELGKRDGVCCIAIDINFIYSTTSRQTPSRSLKLVSGRAKRSKVETSLGYDIEEWVRRDRKERR